MSFVNWFRGIFSNNKVLVYTAIGDEDCMRVVGKLGDARIAYKSKPRGIYSGTGKRSIGFDTKLTQYDIFVDSTNEYRARQVIEELA